MRIYQQPLDEQALWNFLQDKEFDQAIQVIDWYYSPNNPKGFDDPQGVTKSEELQTNFAIDPEGTIEIRKSKRSSWIVLSIVTLVYLAFGILSLQLGGWGPMIIPGIIFPAVVGLVVDLLDNRIQIKMTKDFIEFRKSKKPPILWENILTIYYYHRKSPGGRGAQSADFIDIYKKDAVKAESFSIKGLKIKPSDIVAITNKYRTKNEI